LIKNAAYGVSTTLKSLDAYWKAREKIKQFPKQMEILKNIVYEATLKSTKGQVIEFSKSIDKSSEFIDLATKHIKWGNAKISDL